jgi:outer membrane beta-barrel protein
MLRVSLALSLLLTGLAPGAALAADDATSSDQPADDGDAKATDAAAADAAPSDGTFQRVDERAPRSGTPLIANKLYPMQFRLEVGAFFDYSFNDKYVDHLGGSGTLGFHIFDWLAVEGFGGYLVGGETGIVGNVRNDGSSAKRNAEGQPCADELCQPQLPDLWQTTWFAGADVQWAPIYGKLSAVSELDLSFQLYGLLGGGAEGIQRALGSASAQPFTEQQVRVSLNYGLGVRIIPWKYVALRAELRNYNGLNPNVPEHDQTADEDNCQNGYTLSVGGDKQCYPDISQNTMLQVGLSFLW